MRRSAAVTILALALVASACGGSGRETPPLSIPEEIIGTVPVAEGFVSLRCLFGVGTGKGAEILEVDSDGPASGALEAGDIITEVDGVPVMGPAQLVTVVGAKQPGDVVTLVFTRSGSGPIEEDIQIVEGIEGSETPRLGIIIRTAVDLEEATAIDDSAALESPHSTVMSIDGNLYGVDAVEGIWLNLAIETPEGLWVTLGGDVYVMGEGEPDRILNVTNPDASFEFDAEGWDGDALLGSQGGLLLVAASRVVDDVLQFAIFAIDPDNRELGWSAFPDDADRPDFPQPIFARSSPSQERTLVVTVQLNSQGAVEVLRLNLVDQGGNLVQQVPGGDATVLEGLTISGWLNDSDVVFHGSDTGETILWNVDTGELTPLEISSPTQGTRLVPLGDDVHFIVAGEESVNLIGVGDEISSRRLVVGCTAAVAPPGGFTA